MADFDLPVPLEEEDEAPEEEGVAAPLMALLRQQQAERARANAGLQQAVTQQRAQAQGLRSLGLLSSVGANPLLRNLQGEAGQQGAQLEGMAARTEGRMDAGRGIDPLGIARLQQAAEKMEQDRALALERFGFQKKQAADKAEAARLKSAAGSTAAKEKAATKAEASGIKLEGDLRKEFQALPAYKNYQLSLVAFDQIQRAAQDPSAAGDIAVITNYMRSLDPTTGVKEQEFSNAQNAGGFDDKARAGWERIMTGKRLSPEQRKDFVRAAKANTLAQKDPYDRAEKYYKELAESYKVNPQRVGAPIGVDLGPTTQPPVAPQRTPSAQAMPTDASGNLSLEGPKAAPAGEEMVPMIAPSGARKMVPRSKVDAALKAGGRLANG